MKLQNFATSLLQKQIALLSLVSKKRAAKKAFDIFCTPFSRRKYPLSDFYHQAEKIELQSNAAVLRGFRWNSGGSKKILITHGFQSFAGKFEHIVKKFVQKNYEVIAFDAPAHGYSDSKRITSLLYRDMIKEANEKYGPFDRYLGHSFGCMAICFALTEMPQQKDIKIALIAPASNVLSLSKMFFSQMKITDKELQQLFINHIEKISKLTIKWYDIKRCLQHFNYPVLWIHDRHDKITPVTDALAIQKINISNVDFIFTEGLGHRRIYHDKNIVNHIVDYL